MQSSAQGSLGTIKPVLGGGGTVGSGYWELKGGAPYLSSMQMKYVLLSYYEHPVTLN